MEIVTGNIYRDKDGYICRVVFAISDDIRCIAVHQDDDTHSLINKIHNSADCFVEKLNYKDWQKARGLI